MVRAKRMEHTMKKQLALAGMGIVAAGTMVAGPTANAEERSCRGSLGAVTVDNLRVPQGATCRLNGTTIKGTIYVGTDATLVASSVRVVGNVQAEGHRSVTLSGSTVGGSVQLKQGRAASVTSNRVTGDIQSFTNRGAQAISYNRVNGNLQCKENVPAPTGRGNIVQGNKEDQCRKL
jgi:hypothetical protein